MKIRPIVLLLLVVAGVYMLGVGYIFTHRHIPIPSGKNEDVLIGEYRVINDTQYQIPDVFRGDKLTIQDSGNGTVTVVDDKGNVLPLRKGADGLYFCENFSPVGAWILPGIARNWNEGRIFARDGTVFVEGYMLEMGFMLFVVPFKDVMDWQVELSNAPNNAVNRSGEVGRK
jgi:hypothetical protein